MRMSGFPIATSGARVLRAGQNTRNKKFLTLKFLEKNFIKNNKINFILIVQCALGFYVIFAYISSLFLSELCNETFLTILILVCCIWTYSSQKALNSNIMHPYMIYLITFSLFNLSGLFLDLFGIGDFWNNVPGAYSASLYSIEVKKDTLYCILFFIVFLHLGAILSVKNNGTKCLWKLKLYPNQGLRQFGFFLFIVVVPFFYYYSSTIVYESYLAGGYLEYAVDGMKSGTSSLPFYIRISDDIFVASFWIYLCSLPSFRNAVLVSLVYLFPFISISAFTGSRVHAASQIVAILVYFSMVFQLKLNRFVIPMVFLLGFLVSISIIRSQVDYDFSAAIEMLDNSNQNILIVFLQELGGSAHTIALTVSSISKNLFDCSLRFLVEPLFFQSGYHTSKSDHDYFYLADRLSFYYVDNFSNGAGLGSSIVAEFYAASGMIGVMLLSVCFGFLINFFISKIKNHFCLGLFFIVFPGLLYTARSHPFTFYIFSIKTILVFCIFMFIYRLAFSRSSVFR